MTSKSMGSTLAPELNRMERFIEVETLADQLKQELNSASHETGWADDLPEVTKKKIRELNSNADELYINARRSKDSRS